MKPAVAKKVRDIKGRVRDLRASFVIEIKASKMPLDQLKDPEQRLIPRVTGLVIREGKWLCGLATRMVDRAGDTPIVAEELEVLDKAGEFFKELGEVHADEIKKNLFIFRVDASFITYMEKLILFVEKIDAAIRAKIAAVATIDDDLGDDAELEAQIAAEMTA